MSRLFAGLRDFLLRSTREPVGFIGVALATFAGILLVALLAIALLVAPPNPYIGAVTFLILPAVLIIGLILIPIGAWRHRRRVAREQARATFPDYDLNKPEVRTRLLILAGLTLINIVVLATAAFRGVEFMDSVQFCGATCHPVMKPEYTVYRISPHARVRCVDCHIGPGASWFVQSKLSGSKQVLVQLAGTWPRPIETPIENLRPSRETCEQCHWPEKFQSELLVARTHFQEDEANTPLETIMLLKVGGQTQVGAPRGIHWHVRNDVEYRSDEKREYIPWVRVTRDDGSVQEFVQGTVPDSILARPPRRMDCVDCHNRPTHIYRLPARALDEALAAGLLPRDLPYIRREALVALTVDYPNEAAARAGIARHLTEFYAGVSADSSGAVTRADSSGAGTHAGSANIANSTLVGRAIAATQSIWARYVFPEMRVTWGTYPDHIGHTDFTGCFRCHDEAHTTADGATISQDCSFCHTLLAMEEEKPEIWGTLFPDEKLGTEP